MEEEKGMFGWEQTVDGTAQLATRLNPNLAPWINQTHWEVDYILTHFFTGHGFFRSYVHKITIVDSLNCIYCDSLSDFFRMCSMGRRKDKCGDRNRTNYAREFNLKIANQQACVEHLQSPPAKESRNGCSFIKYKDKTQKL